MRGAIRQFVAIGVLLPLVVAGCADRAQREQLGRQLYVKHGCAVCHGPGGRGDGPAAATLNLPPRDFADASAYSRGSSEEAIVNSIRNGDDEDGSQAMPVFSHLSNDDAELLAAWIVSLQRPTRSSDDAPAIVVRDAWVRESTSLRTVSSGYLLIENHTAREVKVVGVTVERVRRAEFHVVVHAGGQATMRAVPVLAIPARSSVELAPGGTHLMLFGVSPPFLRGQTVMMTLSFDDKRTQTVGAVVRPLSAMTVR